VTTSFSSTSCNHGPFACSTRRVFAHLSGSVRFLMSICHHEPARATAQSLRLSQDLVGFTSVSTIFSHPCSDSLYNLCCFQVNFELWTVDHLFALTQPTDKVKPVNALLLKMNCSKRSLTQRETEQIFTVNGEVTSSPRANCSAGLENSNNSSSRSLSSELTPTNARLLFDQMFVV